MHHKEFSEANPAIDLMRRNDPLLIEAIKKYKDEMPALEIIEVPEGSYEILYMPDGDGFGAEILIKKDCVVWPKNNRKRLAVESTGVLANIEMNVRLRNKLNAVGIHYLHELEKYTKEEVINKCGLRSEEDKKKLDWFIEETKIKLKD
jgi:hypothetical protein